MEEIFYSAQKWKKKKKKRKMLEKCKQQQHQQRMKTNTYIDICRNHSRLVGRQKLNSVFGDKSQSQSVMIGWRVGGEREGAGKVLQMNF